MTGCSKLLHFIGYRASLPTRWVGASRVRGVNTRQGKMPGALQVGGRAVETRERKRYHQVPGTREPIYDIMETRSLG